MSTTVLKTPSETSDEQTVLSGIPHYDNEVFPKIKKGEKVFNWYAGMFSIFWLPYKGLWLPYAKWIIPYYFGIAFLQALNLKSVIIGASIALVFGVGRVANKLYYEHCKRHSKTTSNIGLGVVGVIAGLLLSLFAGNFATSFVASFKSSYNKSATTQTSAAQASNDAKIYQQSSLAVMDGENAIGNRLKFAGMYLGIQTIEDTPVMLISDTQGGVQWWMTFSEQHKASIAQMRVGSAYTFDCVIQKIALAMNVCALQ